MNSLNINDQKDAGDEFGYLCVDDFIKTVIDARSLATAFELRLIDYLEQNGEVSAGTLMGQSKGDSRAVRLLLDLLRLNNILEENEGRIKLTRQFKRALRYRDLLETKIEFANFAAHDFIDFFTDFIANPRLFMQKADMFKLFSYGRCKEFTNGNYELTRRWMRYTTALTRYEAQVCMTLHDFGQYRNMLDIGGNSGEFALQICRNHPGLEASVFDLPLVCRIGQEHLRTEPDAGRISFVPGDALADNLPTGFDLVTFKSVLHDWPDREAIALLDSSLPPLLPHLSFAGPLYGKTEGPRFREYFFGQNKP